MNPASEAAYIAFEEDRRIGSGDLREVARSARQALGRHPHASILIFDSRTSGRSSAGERFGISVNSSFSNNGDMAEPSA